MIRWRISKKVMLPAGTIERTDWDEEKVYVDRTKDQVKDSPPLEETTLTTDPAYRDQLGTYWSRYIHVATFEPNRNGGGC